MGIQNTGPGAIPDFTPAQGVEGKQEQQSEGQKGYSTTDTTSVSDILQAGHIPDAAYPTLQIPLINALSSVFFDNSDIKLEFGNQHEGTGVQLSTLYNFTQMIMAASEREHEIISNVLDGWIEQIREQEEEIQLMLKSPEYQAWLERMDPGYENELRVQYPEAFEIVVKGSGEFHAYLMSLSQEQRAAELNLAVQAEEGLKVGLANVIDNHVQSRNDGDGQALLTLPFLASSLVIGGYMAGNLAEKAASTTMGEAMQGLHQQLPNIMVDSAVITINLFATGILYQATAEALFDAAGKGEKPVDKQMARNFAKETIAKVVGNEINGSLLAMLRDKLVGSTPITHQQIDQLVYMAKIMMSLNALILLYGAETGWMTPEEIAGMINGQMSLAEGSEEAQLVALINQYRKELPPELQAAIFSSMLTLAENKAKAEEMLNPLRVIQRLLEAEDFDHLSGVTTPA